MNSETKVVKNDNTFRQFDKLSAKERANLSKAVIGYGKMKKVVAATALSKDTLAKARQGMNITPETAEIIRTFLNTL